MNTEERTEELPSNLTAVSAASSDDAVAHFGTRLTFETDCWDVHDALSRNADDFVLLDVRRPDAYEAGHVPGTINLRTLVSSNET